MVARVRVEQGVGAEPVKAEGVPQAERPSEAIARRAAQSFEVTDALGRVLTIKKPNPLDNLDFAKAAGAAGLNQLYLSEVAHLKFVAAIDGEAVVCPSTDPELRALYARLGDEGNEAAQLATFKHFAPTEDVTEALKKS